VTDLEIELPKTAAALAAGFQEQLHIGAQLFVSRDGTPVTDTAVGLARPAASGQPELPLRPDTLMLWLSAGKPVAAVAVMQLIEAGRLRLDDPVALHIPEFGANGKERVTIEHLLTHTGGFRFVDIGDATTPPDEVIRRLCVAPLERGWVPGERAGYHPYTSWFVLGEVIRRVADLPFSDYVRRRIFLPLDMTDSWIGMPAAVRDAYGPRLGRLVNTERRGDGAPTLAPHPLSTDEGVLGCVPGAGATGPMRDLARLYAALAGDGELDGSRILSPESVRLLRTRRRIGMFDETFKHTLDWNLGLIPNNRRYGVDSLPYGYGRHAGDAAFGHSGSQSSVGFADPENGLVVALVFNGTCGEPRHQRRIRATLEALYQDLGITRAD
jgi:CubicO group peptidase (beta-lactamase class C family)